MMFFKKLAYTMLAADEDEDILVSDYLWLYGPYVFMLVVFVWTLAKLFT